ncbi:hypothetical protein BON30_17375 [Cystobacter ferrugineus]|uniref:Uncharacterized protein n=2 Tax=Cystobacter ferrugineus TaxID=83449 RepID=A0A1L9BAJ3_9BACT|nr:hypothetical protein BON30_17375 [Cystobacter ferrugineus]
MRWNTALLSAGLVVASCGGPLEEVESGASETSARASELNSPITVARRDFGYTGPIDGIPGPNTYKAEHKIAAYAVNRAF